MEAFKEEHSQLCCPKCRKPISQINAARLTYGKHIKCSEPGCGDNPEFSFRKAYVAPRDHATPIILNPKKIGERSWTHMTMNGENWHREVSEVDGLVIHAGDYEAAADRILGQDESMSDETVINVFTISFKDPESLRVMKPIGEDMNEEILTDMDSYDAAAYINRWEAPGSISIEANPRAMKVDRIESISMGELRKLASFCNIAVEDILAK